MILLLVLSSSLLPGVLIFGLREDQQTLRTTLNLAGALGKLLLVAAMLWGVSHGASYRFAMPVAPGLDLVLHADPLSMLFIVLSSLLWLLTTIYAIGYLEGSPNRSRFFGYFSLCVTSTVGVALAANLFTFIVFYELLTLSTYPLVVHRGTAAARSAGRAYLAYTLAGGALLLLGAVWLHALAGAADFQARGSLGDLPQTQGPALVLIFALLIAGVGVKAALVPLHGWLPRAMIAPAPVSALLHAVAVVKAGAFGIVRVVYDLYGIEDAARLGVTTPLALVVATTILYGSTRALWQDDIKRRLAFSTVSQVSYIALGVAIVGPLATVGGLVHLVHQGLMKITLFFCAGNLAETLGIHKVSEMDGVGRRMPWTMAAFTVGALGMIGLPPLAGFVSKWFLGLGALERGQDWVLLVLAGSSLLNAMYFLPPLHRAWFRAPPAAGWAAERPRQRWEAPPTLLLPALTTALLVILTGLFAAMPFSPQTWAQLIARQEFYGP